MIAFHNVSKIYPPDTVALSEINLLITKGELVLLCGANGSGKTTLLHLINRYERPTKGEVIVFGRNLSEIKWYEVPYLRRRIGVIFQEFKLLRTKTVYENLAFVLQVLGIGEKECRRRVFEMLDKVSLSNRAEVYPRNLSRGEQQRLRIARALIYEPTIILADEPTAHLDAQTTQDITKLLLDANRNGAILIWATQGPDPFPEVKKRLLQLDQGKLVGLDTEKQPIEIKSEIPLRNFHQN
ncbi:MAG: ATP-binding cassette domain-containing protein [bacterium]|nr:ATP-binding cassette domain-containing protein [bacterium]